MRETKSSLPPHVINGMAEGAKKYRYRGLRCLKVPTELALYALLIGAQRPHTIFEIGSKEGGSALWLADQLRIQEVGGRVVSIDIRKPDPFYAGKRVDITLLTGNASQLEWCLTPELLQTCQRPWLVIEDSSHMASDTLAVLRFFDRRMLPGEYIVIEDGAITDIGRAAEFNGGPGKGIELFLEECGGRYEIDAGYCDFYGYNATGNTNGYLRRTEK